MILDSIDWISICTTLVIICFSLSVLIFIKRRISMSSILPVVLNNRDEPSYRRKVIGLYSLDSERKFQHDARNLKYVVHPHPDLKKNPEWKLNLAAGYDSYIQKEWWYENKEKLDYVLEWLLTNRTYLRDLITHTQTQNRTIFVCKRGLLASVMNTPYDDREGWLICATKLKNLIFLCAFFTDGKKTRQQRGQNEKEKKLEYWSFKFEQYLLSDRHDRMGDSSQPVDAREEFTLLYRSQLNKHDIIHAGELDGVNSLLPLKVDGSNVDALNKPSILVELKTSKGLNVEKDTNFQKWKSLKWWLQSYLAGVDQIICGFRDYSGTVTSYRYFDTKNLPDLAKGHWNPRVCQNFLDDFLTFVDTTLSREPDLSKWRFDWKPHSARVTREKITEHSEYNILSKEFVDAMQDMR